MEITYFIIVTILYCITIVHLDSLVDQANLAVQYEVQVGSKQKSYWVAHTIVLWLISQTDLRPIHTIMSISESSGPISVW